MKWQPIETAPKDKLILVGRTKRMDMCTAVNHSQDGWVTETPAEWISIYTPSHWMPLPAAPDAKCRTCSGHGAVGNILTAEPCPDCAPSPAAPGAKVLTDEDMEALSLTHGLKGDVEEMAIIVETMVLDRLAADESFEDRISDWAHGDALDAARYRWLRDNATRSGVNIDIGAGVEISETLDAAVDDAMRLTAAKESP